MYKTLFGAILAVLLLGTAVPGISSDDLFDRKSYALHLGKGIKHLEAGRHNAAIREFEEAAAQNPDAEAYYYLGYVYYLKAQRRGDRESQQKSQENFALSHELDPEFKPRRPLPGIPAALAAQGVGDEKKQQPSDIAEPSKSIQEVSSSIAIPPDVFFRANQQRTGDFNANRITTVPSIKWKYKTEGSYLSAPIAFRDMVYIGDEIYIYAINSETGTLRWKYPVSGAGTPAVVNRTLYFGGGDNSLFAMNAFIGTVQWKIKAGTVQPSSPATSGGLIFFGSGSFAGGNGYGSLIAVDAATGEERWKFKTQNSVTTPPAVYDGTVYFGYGNSGILLSGWQVFAVNAADGTKKWETAHYLPLTGAPVVTADAVYFGINANSTGALIAVSRSTGQELWKLMVEGAAHTPAFSDGVVFFGTSENMAGTSYAVAAATGKILWRYHTDKWFDTPPAVAGDIVYFTNNDGVLHALDVKTGRELWQFKAERKYPVAPLPSGKTIYFGSGGILYALE